MGKQTGSSLVETMVALFVLAIGLLGVLAMQVKGMQYNQSAYSYSQAVYLANDLAERIRSNIALGPADFGAYALAETADVDADCGENGCDSAAARARMDLSEWQTNVREKLPAATTEVEVQNRQFVIVVGFDDSRAAGAITDVDTNGQQLYRLTVEI